jgi:hypothetical protein
MVKPLGVVDKEQHWYARRRFTEQVQRGKGDEEEFGGGHVRHAESGQYSISLGSRKLFDFGEDWSEELVQTCEGQLGLRLDTRGCQDTIPAIFCLGHRRLQQGRLPNTSPASDHQGSAVLVRSVDEFGERTQLVFTAQQHGRSSRQSDGD